MDVTKLHKQTGEMPTTLPFEAPTASSTAVSITTAKVLLLKRLPFGALWIELFQRLDSSVKVKENSLYAILGRGLAYWKIFKEAQTRLLPLTPLLIRQWLPELDDKIQLLGRRWEERQMLLVTMGTGRERLRLRRRTRRVPEEQQVTSCPGAEVPRTIDGGEDELLPGFGERCFFTEIAKLGKVY